MNSTITDERLKEAIATAIAPLAWAALGAGDTLAHLNRRKASLRHAEAALMAIEASGLALVPATDASELLAAREALRSSGAEAKIAEQAAEIERLRERLQAIIDWCDLALANPQEFNSHGVKNLSGPTFDEARAALAEIGSGK